MYRGSAFFFSAALLLAACGAREPGAGWLTAGSNTPGLAGHGSAEEAALAKYRYAFTGQVLDEKTGAALSDFSVSLLSKDGAVSTLLNGFGEKNGIFHISRNPMAADAAFRSLAVLISSPGHKPLMRLIDVGADCVAGQCPGSKAVSIKLTSSVSAGLTGAKAAFSPATVTQKMAVQGTGAAFQELVAAGKLDLEAQKILLGAKNGDVLNNVLVLLGGAPSGQSADLVQSLLSGANQDKLKGLTSGGAASTLIPLIANSSPELSSAMLAANLILPYLTPMLNQKLQGQTGPFATMLKTLLTDPNAQQNLANLISLLGNKQADKTQTIQAALNLFLPMLQSLVAKKAGTTQNPLESFLLRTITDPKFFDALTSLGNKSVAPDQKLTSLLTYLNPLVQGLGGQKAPELAYLFNLLLSEGGIQSLKNFPKDGTAQEKFAKLLPYIEPIIKGLNGTDGSQLSSLLQPLLTGSNPAAAVRDLLAKAGTGTGKSAEIIAALMPALDVLLKQTTPGKQVLSAQLLQGLVNGDFGAIQVTRDLQGAPAVLVSGQARDIFKLAQLPNVDQVVALTP